MPAKKLKNKSSAKSKVAPKKNKITKSPAKIVKKIIKKPAKAVKKSAKLVKKSAKVKAPKKKLVTKKLPAPKKTMNKKAANKKPANKKPVNNKKLSPKPLAKPLVKSTAKKLKKTTIKITKKLVKKPVKKENIKKPAIKETKKIAEKKLSKKAGKKLPKIKEPTAKTSAKIIAKAKSDSKENKNKAPEVEVATPDKKSDSQKNLIIVKKLSESRLKVAFKKNDFAVYPSHGVGQIQDIEKTTALGQDFSCYLMYFDKEKLTIKIPVNSAEKIGLRHLVSKTEMDEIFVILRSGVKKLKGMWSRRAQEYETKINSGDIVLLAEVLRDLTRDIEDGERSYSERIIYETAVNRLASEYSIVCGVDFEEARDKVISTAKDKLGTEGKAVQKDEFDEFDYDNEEASEGEEEEEDEEDEDEEGDGYYDDEDDDGEKKPRKKSKKSKR